MNTDLKTEKEWFDILIDNLNKVEANHLNPDKVYKEYKNLFNEDNSVDLYTSDPELVAGIVNLKAAILMLMNVNINND